jgi:hypothetical protein
MTLDDYASILEAGARRSRQWTYNTERQQQADVLDAMAAEARSLSRDKDDFQ